MLHEAAGAGVRAGRRLQPLQDKQTPADGLFVPRARDGHHTNKIKPLRQTARRATVMQKKNATPASLNVYIHTHLGRERKEQNENAPRPPN